MPYVEAPNPLGPVVILLGSMGTILVGSAVVLYGVERLLRGSSVLSRRRGLSEFAYGMTVAAFVTSAPELLINSLHALRGGQEIVVGNVLGSNMFNVLAVLGFAAFTGRIAVSKEVVWRTVPLLGLITLALFPLLWDQVAARSDGVVLILAAIAYLAFEFRDMPHESGVPGRDAAWQLGDHAPSIRLATWFGVGVLALFVGARIVVAGGELLDSGVGGLARGLSENPTLYGVSVLAVCTSLPEIALGVGAVARRQKQLLAGAVLGSCVFNVTIGFGTASFLMPSGVAAIVVNSALVLNVVAIAGCLGLLLTTQRLNKFVGGTMVATYAAFVGWLVLEAIGHDLARPAFWVAIGGCALPGAVAFGHWAHERLHAEAV